MMNSGISFSVTNIMHGVEVTVKEDGSFWLDEFRVPDEVLNREGLPKNNNPSGCFNHVVESGESVVINQDHTIIGGNEVDYKDGVFIINDRFEIAKSELAEAAAAQKKNETAVAQIMDEIEKIYKVEAIKENIRDLEEIKEVARGIRNGGLIAMVLTRAASLASFAFGSRIADIILKSSSATFGLISIGSAIASIITQKKIDKQKALLEEISRK